MARNEYKMKYTLEYWSGGEQHYETIEASRLNDAIMKGQRWLQLHNLQDVIDRNEWGISKDE